MAPYGYQVTMGIPWRNGEEEFSNVLHYDHGIAEADEAHFDAAADSIVTILKTIYTNTVSFKRVRVYGPTDGPKADNIMRLVKDVSGLGSASKLASIPAESAIVAQIYVGRGPRGGKQYLRKYFHVAAVSQSSSGSAGALGNGALAAGDKTAVSAGMNNLKNVGSAGASSLPICTPNGKHLPAGAPIEVLGALHTRQFRR